MDEKKVRRQCTLLLCVAVVTTLLGAGTVLCGTWLSVNVRDLRSDLTTGRWAVGKLWRLIPPNGEHELQTDTERVLFSVFIGMHGICRHAFDALGDAANAVISGGTTFLCLGILNWIFTRRLKKQLATLEGTAGSDDEEAVRG